MYDDKEIDSDTAFLLFFLFVSKLPGCQGGEPGGGGADIQQKLYAKQTEPDIMRTINIKAIFRRTALVLQLEHTRSWRAFDTIFECLERRPKH